MFFKGYCRLIKRFINEFTIAKIENYLNIYSKCFECFLRAAVQESITSDWGFTAGGAFCAFFFSKLHHAENKHIIEKMKTRTASR
ncbi:hypothetical protein A4R26_12150 [Niastella populi]|uniref:Uncharacterized protein n=1 Tax=Niastella populi TaxID=550983 RepID=A0A1V9GAH5_9BACT|nr:hypothetical protein A4R26_12150 [Niastella populi]